MKQSLIALSLAGIAFAAVPAAATTTIVVFDAASCAGGCIDYSFIDQTVGDTANVDVSHRTTHGTGNATTSENALRFWSGNYSGSAAAWANTTIGEIRLTTLSAGTVTLDSVDFGGYLNAVRDIDYRVYDFSWNLLTSGTVATAPTSLTTISFGQSSADGLIFQFGPDGYNGGIQNLTFSFESGIAPVPEPASWAMLIAGFGLTGTVMRRRRAILA